MCFDFRWVGPSPLAVGEPFTGEDEVVPDANAVSLEGELSDNVARKTSASAVEKRLCDFLANFKALGISPSAFFRRAIPRALPN